ncbi:mitosis inhibitor protein kinase swe1 [Blastocladiella emersonii ATCC 22665]|nr:mitosis inhibitor protein kinase swe1 [Blastocladiella emersonii ATCC 22665]
MDVSDPDPAPLRPTSTPAPAAGTFARPSVPASRMSQSSAASSAAPSPAFGFTFTTPANAPASGSRGPGHAATAPLLRGGSAGSFHTSSSSSSGSNPHPQPPKLPTPTFMSAGIISKRERRLNPRQTPSTPLRGGQQHQLARFQVGMSPVTSRSFMPASAPPAAAAQGNAAAPSAPLSPQAARQPLPSATPLPSTAVKQPPSLYSNPGGPPTLAWNGNGSGAAPVAPAASSSADLFATPARPAYTAQNLYRPPSKRLQLQPPPQPQQPPQLHAPPSSSSPMSIADSPASNPQQPAFVAPPSQIPKASTRGVANGDIIRRSRPSSAGFSANSDGGGSAAHRRWVHRPIQEQPDFPQFLTLSYFATGAQVAAAAAAAAASTAAGSPSDKRPALVRADSFGLGSAPEIDHLEPLPFLPPVGHTDAVEYPSYVEQHFRVERVLGSGAFSNAYAVVRVVDGRRFALKQLKRPYTSALDRRRRLEEVHIWQRVGRHRNCLALELAWEQRGSLYMLSELCDRGSLAAFLDAQADTGLNEDQVWEVLSDIADGLFWIHSRGLAHLDLKPANLFITHEGVCKIGDFGLTAPAEMLDRTLYATGAAASQPGFADALDPSSSGPASQGGSGTPLPPQALSRFLSARTDDDRDGDATYAAPEANEGRYGMENDVYAFGLIALEMVSNSVLPTDGEPYERLRRGNIEDFADVIPETTSAELMFLITTCLLPYPCLRPSIRRVRELPMLRDAHVRRLSIPVPAPPPMDPIVETRFASVADLVRPPPVAPELAGMSNIGGFAGGSGPAAGSVAAWGTTPVLPTQTPMKPAAVPDQYVPDPVPVDRSQAPTPTPSTSKRTAAAAAAAQVGGDENAAAAAHSPRRTARYAAATGPRSQPDDGGSHGRQGPRPISPGGLLDPDLSYQPHQMLAPVPQQPAGSSAHAAALSCPPTPAGPRVAPPSLPPAVSRVHSSSTQDSTPSSAEAPSPCAGTSAAARPARRQGIPPPSASAVASKKPRGPPPAAAAAAPATAAFAAPADSGTGTPRKRSSGQSSSPLDLCDEVDDSPLATRTGVNSRRALAEAGSAARPALGRLSFDMDSGGPAAGTRARLRGMATFERSASRPRPRAVARSIPLRPSASSSSAVAHPASSAAGRGRRAGSAEELWQSSQKSHVYQEDSPMPDASDLSAGDDDVSDAYDDGEGDGDEVMEEDVASLHDQSPSRPSLPGGGAGVRQRALSHPAAVPGAFAFHTDFVGGYYAQQHPLHPMFQPAQGPSPPVSSQPTPQVRTSSISSGPGQGGGDATLAEASPLMPSALPSRDA